MCGLGGWTYCGENLNFKMRNVQKCKVANTLAFCVTNVINKHDTSPQ